jgi:hypothetical protein
MSNFWQDAPSEIKDLAQQLMRDIQAADLVREREQVKADPETNRTTRIFVDGGSGYRYYSAINGRGSQVRYCYSTRRNIAGYFLIWREVETKRQIKRDRWDSTKTKRDAMAECRRRWRG